jgi:hypothetical protein
MSAAVAIDWHTSPVTTKWKELQSVVIPGWVGVGVVTTGGGDVVDVVEVVEETVIVVVLVAGHALVELLVELLYGGIEELQHSPVSASYPSRTSFTAW